MMDKLLFWVVFLVIGLSFSQSRTSLSSAKYNAAYKLEQSGKYRNALAYYKQLTENYPTDIRYHAAVARIISLTNSIEDAKLYLQELLLLQDHPPINWIYLELANYTIKEQNINRTQEIWQNIVKNTNDEKLLKAIIHQMFSAGQNDLARTTISQLRQRLAKQDFYASDLANYLKTHMNWTDAVKEYLLYVSNNPRQIHFVSGQISKLPDDENISASIIQTIQTFAKTHPQFNHTTTQILSDFYYQRKNFNKAIVTTASQENAEKKLEKLGKEMIKDGHISPAIQVFMQLLSSSDNQDKKQEYRFQLAECSFHKSRVLSPFSASPIRSTEIFPFGAPIFLFDPEEAQIALEHFQNLLQSPTRDIHNRALLKTAFLELHFKHNPEKALESLKLVNKINRRQRAEIDFLRFEAAQMANDKKMLNQILRTYQKTNSTHRYFGEFRKKLIENFLKNEQFEIAVDSLQNTRKTIQFDDIFFNDFLQMSRFLKSYYTNTDDLGKQAFAQYLRGEWMVQQGDFVGALAHFTAITKDFISYDIAEVATFRVGLLSSEIGKMDTAVNALTQLLHDFPNSTLADMALYRLGEIEIINKTGKEKLFFEKILIDFPFSTLTESARLTLREIEE